MKGFFRVLSGLLLVMILGTFVGWRDGSVSIANDLTWPSVYLIGNSSVENTEESGTSRPSGGTAPSDQNADFKIVETVDASLEAVICAGITDLNDSIDISSFLLTEDMLVGVIANIQYSHPEFFYLGAKCGYYMSGGFVQSIKPTYLYSAETVAAMNEVYEQEINAIAAGVNPAWGDFDKALYLHDYFLRNYCYDYTYTIKDAYTFFANKTGVCQAYMLAMIAVGQAVGLEVLPVTSNEMLHAWNLVKIDGAWYHVDLTWDDSSANPAMVSYRYFLQSDSGLAAIDDGSEDVHRAWSTKFAANNEKYDHATYRYATTPLIRSGNNYYCVLSIQSDKKFVHGAIYGGTDVTDLKELQEISAQWQANVNSYYTNCYSGLCLYQGLLIYNTSNTLRIYNATTGEDRSIGFVSLPLGESIYGIWNISGSVLTLVSSDAPQGEPRMVEVDISDLV